MRKKSQALHRSFSQSRRTLQSRHPQIQFRYYQCNVWGDYGISLPHQKAPHITHGYSKDKRPDLKQFMVSMLCVEGNIPISGKRQNGNPGDENPTTKNFSASSDARQPDIRMHVTEYLAERKRCPNYGALVTAGFSCGFTAAVRGTERPSRR